MKYFFCLLLASLFVSCSNKDDGSEKNNIAYLKSEDQELKRLQDTAQAHLPYLITFMEEHKKDSVYEYYVKASFTDNGQTEHMWVLISDFQDNFFIGNLANDPLIVKNISNGDNVKVFKKDVEDWLLNNMVTNASLGGYSQQYLKENQ